MRASWTIEGLRWQLVLLPDQEDELESPRAPHLRMLTNTASVVMPFKVAEPHPDLLALAAYSVAWPWTARRLRLDRPVSSAMAEAFAEAGVEVSPVAGDPRRPGGRAVLSYSGGADSIATAELLPKDTPHVHLRRVKHPRVPNRMTHVRGDVLEGLVREAGQRGREIAVVQTDLEYVCLPFATFPVWWAISIGSILIADHYDGGAVALGTVLESLYTSNGRKWVGRGVNRSTHALYQAAGIPLLRPVAGMTEVATTKLAMESDLADLVRSCLLGTGGPCLNCDKCLRKEMTTAALTGSRLPEKLLSNLETNPKVRAKIADEPPLYFQDMVEYALARVDVSGTILEPIKRRLAPTVDGTAWAERYYEPALEDEVPPAFRTGVGKRVSELMDFMSAEDRHIVETWDAARRVNEPAPTRP